ncbi:MAG TPA: hypothetical protein VHF51_14410, partial [Solirubrobacteraceae bacterium]|nr:hypothetical protein [Solirubrobacteraceae bacterium]
MDLDRLSPRLRGRWISVAGVVLATGSIGIGTFSLSSDVLPFDAWPGGSDGPDSQQLLAAAASGSRASQSASGRPVAGVVPIVFTPVAAQTGATISAADAVVASVRRAGSAARGGIRSRRSRSTDAARSGSRRPAASASPAPAASTPAVAATAA